MSSTVYIVRCNDATEFIVDAVAYDTLDQAERYRDAMDASQFNAVCGPHGVYPLTLRVADDADRSM